jgi:hypothetical protein
MHFPVSQQSSPSPPRASSSSLPASRLLRPSRWKLAEGWVLLKMLEPVVVEAPVQELRARHSFFQPASLP